MRSFDVCVIGGGPGGHRAAIRSAQAGFKTALIEKEFLGGTCLNWGCIPSKALLASSELFSKMAHSAEWGIMLNLPPAVNPAQIIAQKDEMLGQFRKSLERELGLAKVTLLAATARLSSANTIDITAPGGAETIESKIIILATGSRPKSLPGITFNGSTILSSNDLVSLSKIPESILLIGGGAIGVEFATFFSQLGCRVTVIEALSRLLPLEDLELGKRLESLFQRRGIQVLTGANVLKVVPEGDLIRAELEGGQSVKAQQLAVVAGRIPNTDSLGLDRAGVKLKGMLVDTNAHLQTSARNIYAIGDLIEGPKLAHAATYEADLVIRNLKAGQTQSVNYEIIPNAIFSNPPVASIGLTIEKAKAKGFQAVELKIPLAANAKAVVERETDGFFKLVADPASGKILGAHLIGAGATEQIGWFSLVLERGLTVNQLASVVFSHPSLAEMFSDLAQRFPGLKY